MYLASPKRHGDRKPVLTGVIITSFLSKQLTKSPTGILWETFSEGPPGPAYPIGRRGGVVSLVSGNDSREASGVEWVQVCLWLAMDPGPQTSRDGFLFTHWLASVWMQLGSVGGGWCGPPRALTLLSPRGRDAALCADGPQQSGGDHQPAQHAQDTAGKHRWAPGLSHWPPPRGGASQPGG